MLKIKFVLFSIFLALLAVVLLLSGSWGLGTAVAAPAALTTTDTSPPALNQLSRGSIQAPTNSAMLMNALATSTTLTSTFPSAVIPDDGYDGTLASMSCDTIIAPSPPAGEVVSDVSIGVAATHTWVGDLTIKLRSPNGTILTVLNRPGSPVPDNGTNSPFGNSANWGIADPGTVITFADGAGPEAETMGAVGMEIGTGPNGNGIGIHDPSPDTGPGIAFSDFRGGPVAGAWTLCLGDGSPTETGTWEGWTLHLESDVIPCAVEATGDNITDFTSADASAVQAAVDQASPGDLLKVAGSCVGVQTRNGLSQTVYISQSVTIQGGYEVGNWTLPPNPNLFPTILDAGGNGRVIYMPSGNRTIVLDRLTLAHGNGDGGNGGGIFAGTDLNWSLTNSTVSENTSSVSGGGIYNAALQFTANNSTLISNTAVLSNGLGGGLYSTGIVGVHITNSTVENNQAIDGGGIHIDSGGTLTLTGSLIQGNHANNNGGGLANDSNTGVVHMVSTTIMSNTAADSGGGIFNNGTITMDDSTISANQADNDGGGLYNDSIGLTTIMNSMFTDNRVEDTALLSNQGGGIYNTNGGNVIVMTSTLQHNLADNSGGAIANDGTFSLQASTLLSNTGNTDGGGVWNRGNLEVMQSDLFSNTTSVGDGGAVINLGAITITNSTLAFNTSTDGGGIYNTANGTISLVRSTIKDNHVSGTGNNRGGAIFMNNGSLDLVNSTLSQNSASNWGGAVWNNGFTNLTHATIVSNTIGSNTGSGIYNSGAGAVMTLTNSIVAYNSGAANVDCAVGAGSVVDNGYNLVEDGSCVSAGTSLSGDPSLGALADNGGDTDTHLPLAFSPVIDTIPALSCGAANDQIGTIRPVDGACDIGSVELAVNFAPIAAGDEYTTTEDMTLTVVAPGVLSNDIDADFGPLTPITDTNVTSGTLTLNSDGSLEYVPNTDFCGVDSFMYHVNDGHVDSNTVTVTLNVTCVNDAPVAVADMYATTEDVTLNVAAPGVLSNDSDAEGDPLTAVLDTGVMTGTLIFTSDGSFDYVPDANFCGTDGFTYHANDGQADSITVSVTLDIACVNDAPVAVGDSYTTDEDTTLNVAAPGVLSNDSDADGDPLMAVLDTGVMTGTLVFSPDGSFDYIPDADFCGTDSFTYHANDGQVNSNSVSVTLDVTCVPDLPVAQNDVYSTPEDTPLIVPAPGVLSNDSDADGDPLTAVLDTDVITGTLVFSPDGSFDFTPLMSWSGITTFTYHVEAGGDSSNIATVTLVVGSVNDAPVAVDDSYTTDEDTPLNVAAPGVLANDTDEDGDPLTAVLDTDVTTGTLTLNSDGSFDYTPPSDWFGVTTFTYHANDGLFDSNTAVVTLTVTSVNDAPVAVADVYTTTEDTLLTVPAPGVLDNDSDADGDPLTAVLDSDVTNGTLVLNADGSFTYTPDPDFCSVDSFMYHADDGPNDSNTVVVMLDVACVNDAPVAVADSYSTDEDVVLNVAAPGVLSNDIDADGDMLTAVLDSDVMTGTLVFNADGSFAYVPPLNWSGVTTFTYHANDGLEDSNTVLVTISVGIMNTPPVATDDSYTVFENSSDNSLDVLANDSDADGDTLTIIDVSTPGNGTAVISGEVILYTPDANFEGTDMFTYTVSDGLSTATATVTINVVPGGFTVYLPFIVVAP